MKIIFLQTIALLFTLASCKKDACSNGILDGNEVETDCGGNNCVPCPMIMNINATEQILLGTWMHFRMGWVGAQNDTTWKYYDPTQKIGFIFLSQQALVPGVHPETMYYSFPTHSNVAGWYIDDSTNFLVLMNRNHQILELTSSVLVIRPEDTPNEVLELHRL